MGQSDMEMFLYIGFMLSVVAWIAMVIQHFRKGNYLLQMWIAVAFMWFFNFLIYICK